MSVLGLCRLEGSMSFFSLVLIFSEGTDVTLKAWLHHLQLITV